uniref:Calmin n=1 Tax=Pan troglodytes TaxID=9598 RepID=G2HGA4_PANTR|nr:calmin [Pan troglodytes]
MNLIRTPEKKLKAVLQPQKRHQWIKSQRCMKRPRESPPVLIMRKREKTMTSRVWARNCLPAPQAAVSAWRPLGVTVKKAWISGPPHPSQRFLSFPTTSSISHTMRFPWLQFWRLT